VLLLLVEGDEDSVEGSVSNPESSDRLLCSSRECSLSSRLVPTSWFPLFSLLGISKGVEENLGWPLRKYGRGVSSAKVTWFGGEMSKAESSSRLDPLASLMPLELELPIESKVLLAFVFTDLMFESEALLALLFPINLPDLLQPRGVFICVTVLVVFLASILLVTNSSLSLKWSLIIIKTLPRISSIPS